MEFAYTVSGFVVGFIVGMTGVGGGSLMTPLLVLVFGVNPATAVGTDLLYASITKGAGVWVHSKRGNVDWKLVGLLAAGSLPAALLCVVLLRVLGVETSRVSGIITGSLGVALILTALALLFKERLQRLASRKAIEGESWRQRHVVAVTVATGAVVAEPRLGRVQLTVPPEALHDHPSPVAVTNFTFRSARLMTFSSLMPGIFFTSSVNVLIVARIPGVKISPCFATMPITTTRLPPNTSSITLLS